MPPTYKRVRKNLVADPERGTPRLTRKQELFCLALLEGKSDLEAYNSAFGNGQAKDETRKVSAFRMRNTPKIQDALRFYQRNAQDISLITKEKHLAELARGREIAYDLGQASAGIQAEHYRGKVAGLYEDKTRLSIGPTDESLLSQIAALLGEDMAKAIGEGLGVEEGEAVELVETRESRLLKAPSGLND